MPENDLNNLVNYVSDKSGLIIVIDGSDGSGKATQTKKLLEELDEINNYKKLGFKISTLDFPQYGKNAAADIVGEYLDGSFGDPVTISPYLASFPFAVDRFSEKKKLLAFKEKKNIAVLNRYITSNLGYQGGKLGAIEEQNTYIDRMENIEYEILGIPRPDIVIYLNTPAEVARLMVMLKEKRDYAKKCGKLDWHERNMEYQNSVVELYKRICKERVPGAERNSKITDVWLRIDCGRKDYPKELVVQLESSLEKNSSEKNKEKVRQEISEKLLLPPEEIHEIIVSALDNYIATLL